MVLQRLTAAIIFFATATQTLVTVAQAQSNEGHTVTLEQSIKLALQQNYTVAQSQNSRLRSQLELKRNHDALLPSVSASAGYGYDYSLVPLADRTTVIPADPLLGSPQREIVTPAGSHSLNYSLNGSLNLFNGGSDAARIRSAQATLNGADATLDWTKQQIAFNVTSGYINALRMRELVQSAQKTLSESQAELDRVRGQFDAGAVPVGQVYQQEAVVGQDRVAVIQAQNNYDNSKADLLFLLNISPDKFDSYHITIEGIDTSMSLERRAAVDTTIQPGEIDRAVASRPDIKADQAAIESATAQVDVIHGQLLPSLDARASIGGGGAGSDLLAIHTTNSLSAGLNLSIPILDRGQNEILSDEQEAQIESLKIQLQQDEQTIRSDITKAVNNVRAADEALDATSDALRSAEESYRLAEEQLKVGAGTQVDVIVAQAQLETSRVNRVNAKYNYVLAQRQLQFTLGTWNY